MSKAATSSLPPLPFPGAADIPLEYGAYGQKLPSSLFLLESMIMTAVYYLDEKCKEVFQLRWEGLRKRMETMKTTKTTNTTNAIGYDLGQDLAVFITWAAKCPAGINFISMKPLLIAMSEDEYKNLCQQKDSGLCGMWQGLYDGLKGTSKADRKRHLAIGLGVGLGLGIPFLTISVLLILFSIKI